MEDTVSRANQALFTLTNLRKFVKIKDVNRKGRLRLKKTELSEYH
jgi:hypothetical protein